MTKLFVVAALCLVGAALSTTVCMPSPNWVEVQEWTDQNSGYTASYQFLDVATGFFRMTDIEFFEHGSSGKFREIGQDVLVDSKAQKVYIVQGNPQDPKSLTCKVITQEGTVKDPCLTYNATKISTNTVGTEMVDNYYTEDSHHGVKLYGRLLFTQSGIPVNFVTWSSYGHNEQLFLNFNQTLPTNAFAVPSICSQATAVTMSGSQLVKEYKLEGKFQPAH